MAILKAKVIRQAKKKSATRGRDSCYSRPQVTLLAAAVRATRGREQRYLRPRVDKFFVGLDELKKSNVWLVCYAV